MKCHTLFSGGGGGGGGGSVYSITILLSAECGQGILKYHIFLSFSVKLMSIIIIIKMTISYLRTLHVYASKGMTVMTQRHRYCCHGDVLAVNVSSPWILFLISKHIH